MNDSFVRYLNAGFDSVEGWLSPTTAHIMATLADEQTRRRVVGDIAEIGVHHGKSFLALANSIAPGERLFAIDVFEDQHKNADNSGSGSREMFLANMRAYAPGKTAEIIRESSLDLPAQGWPKSRAGSIRFFSIDGSHTRDATLNDLQVAELTATRGGLVVLDDVLSSHWLGVISGLFDYLLGGGALLPIAIIPNKLLLATDPASKSEWSAFLRERYARSISKSGVDLFGHGVDVIEDDPSLLRPKPKPASELELWQAFSTSRVYRVARAYMSLRGHTPPA
ncbi:Methyltransferase domain-containing protein [Rhizobiales bacterium GAS113]|nr:Methyltransferase domain-containing protein [Rhizobiales bacterium GAS113]